MYSNLEWPRHKHCPAEIGFPEPRPCLDEDSEPEVRTASQIFESRKELRPPFRIQKFKSEPVVESNDGSGEWQEDFNHSEEV